MKKFSLNCLMVGLILFPILGCTKEANDLVKPWITKIECGQIKIEVLSACEKSNSSSSLNSCTHPQKIIFNSGAINKKISLPNFSEKDRAAYKHADTIDGLYATGWKCFRRASGDFVEISYWTGTGRTRFDERSEYYFSDGKFLADEMIDQELIAFIENSRAKASPIKSILPE